MGVAGDHQENGGVELPQALESAVHDLQSKGESMAEEPDSRPEIGSRVIVHTWRGDIHGTLISFQEAQKVGIMYDIGPTILADDGEYLRPNWERVIKEPVIETKHARKKSRR